MIFSQWRYQKKLKRGCQRRLTSLKTFDSKAINTFSSLPLWVFQANATSNWVKSTKIILELSWWRTLKKVIRKEISTLLGEWVWPLSDRNRQPWLLATSTNMPKRWSRGQSWMRLRKTRQLLKLKSSTANSAVSGRVQNWLCNRLLKKSVKCREGRELMMESSTPHVWNLLLISYKKVLKTPAIDLQMWKWQMMRMMNFWMRFRRLS